MKQLKCADLRGGDLMLKAADGSLIYQFVAEQNGISAATLFHGNDARISPSTLASLLQSNPWFEEAGYVMPGER